MNALLAGPSVADERARELREAARRWEKASTITAAQRRAIEGRFPTTWRSSGPVLTIVAFCLTVFAVASFAGLARLLSLPYAIVTAFVAIAVAEGLMCGQRSFWTGIEAALWISGLIAAIFALPSSGKVEAILVFSAAFALAGWRTRTPLFGALAAALTVVYVSVTSTSIWPAIILAFALALSAAVALQREWLRPSTERLFAFIVVLLPVTGYGCAVVQLAFGSGVSDVSSSIQLWIALALLAVALLAIGVIQRARAILVSGGIVTFMMLFELRDLFWWPLEAQLIVAGALFVAIAAVLSRTLRGRRTGFVVARSEITPYDEAMQIGGTLAVAPSTPAPAADPGFEGGGGGFGGAGATGDY